MKSRVYLFYSSSQCFILYTALQCNQTIIFACIYMHYAWLKQVFKRKKDMRVYCIMYIFPKNNFQKTLKIILKNTPLKTESKYWTTFIYFGIELNSVRVRCWIRLRLSVRGFSSAPLTSFSCRVGFRFFGVYISTMKTTFLYKFWLLTCFFESQVYKLLKRSCCLIIWLHCFHNMYIQPMLLIVRNLNWNQKSSSLY